MPHVEYIFAIHSPRGDKDDHKVANLEYVNYISYGISILLWYEGGEGGDGESIPSPSQKHIHRNVREGIKTKIPS